MFDYDWFHGAAYTQQKQVAKWRCAVQHFPDVDEEHAEDNAEFMAFYNQLEQRTLIYLRDGFSYEVKQIADVDTKSHLVFECMPVDEQYKVGAFIVTVPFEELVRVEVYAVHPTEKPDDLPQITGFRVGPDDADDRPLRDGKPGKARKSPKPVKPGR